MYQVFGSQMLEELVDIGYQRDVNCRWRMSRRGSEIRWTRVFALRGFVSRPQVQKMNRNSVFLFVNGRLIRDRLLMHALSSAYHNLMPPACYPFALLFLDCDCEEVDVNVHPSKTEVRFRHGSFVHDFLRDSIRELLMASRPVSNCPCQQCATRGRACRIPSSRSASRIMQCNEYAVMPAAVEAERDLPVMTLAPPAFARAAIRFRRRAHPLARARGDDAAGHPGHPRRISRRSRARANRRACIR